MTANARRLAVVAASLCLLAGSGLASAGNDESHSTCNAGRGNGYELSLDGGTTVDGQPNDCDPGNSGPHNHGGDANPVGV